VSSFCFTGDCSTRLIERSISVERQPVSTSRYSSSFFSTSARSSLSLPVTDFSATSSSSSRRFFIVSYSLFARK